MNIAATRPTQWGKTAGAPCRQKTARTIRNIHKRKRQRRPGNTTPGARPVPQLCSERASTRPNQWGKTAGAPRRQKTARTNQNIQKRRRQQRPGNTTPGARPVPQLCPKTGLHNTPLSATRVSQGARPARDGSRQKSQASELLLLLLLLNPHSFSARPIVAIRLPV